MINNKIKPNTHHHTGFWNGWAFNKPKNGGVPGKPRLFIIRLFIISSWISRCYGNSNVFERALPVKYMKPAPEHVYNFTKDLYRLALANESQPCNPTESVIHVWRTGPWSSLNLMQVESSGFAAWWMNGWIYVSECVLNYSRFARRRFETLFSFYNRTFKA